MFALVYMTLFMVGLFYSVTGVIEIGLMVGALWFVIALFIITGKGVIVWLTTH